MFCQLRLFISFETLTEKQEVDLATHVKSTKLHLLHYLRRAEEAADCLTIVKYSNIGGTPFCDFFHTSVKQSADVWTFYTYPLFFLPSSLYFPFFLALISLS